MTLPGHGPDSAARRAGTAMVMTREPQADPCKGGRSRPQRPTGPDAARRLATTAATRASAAAHPAFPAVGESPPTLRAAAVAAAALAFIGGLPEAAWAVVTVIVVSGLVGFVLDYWSDRISRLRRRAPAVRHP